MFQIPSYLTVSTAIVIPFALLSACSSTDDNLIPYESEYFDFTIQFPEEPQWDEVEENEAAGILRGESVVYEVDNDEVFMVFVTKFETGIVESQPAHILLDSSLQGAVGDDDLLSSAEIELQGFPGREALIEGTLGEDSQFLRVNYYLREDNLYQVVFSSNDKGRLEVDEVNNFFDSFEFTGE